MRKAYLNIWLEPNNEMRIQLVGDPVDLAKMIRTSMAARQDIAAMFIVSVVEFAKEQGYDSGDLGKMAYIIK